MFVANLTLELPTKNTLKIMSSAANNCITLLTNLSLEANSVDPDQMAPNDLCLIWVHIVCQKGF